MWRVVRRQPASVDILSDHAENCRAGLERLRAKHALGLDPRVDTGLREENASK
jgi:hypothetical protein